MAAPSRFTRRQSPPRKLHSPRDQPSCPGGSERSFSARQRIVDAAVTPGASVAGVARATGVNANLLFKWIRRSREGWQDRRCGAGDGARAATSSSREASETPKFVPIRLVADLTDRCPASLRSSLAYDFEQIVW